MDKRELAYELETLGLQVDKLYELCERNSKHALKQYVHVSQQIIQMIKELRQ